MRKSLLESFDKIYILDLHGNAKKKEVCPDGSTDQNVFDIMQGVSINIFVKSGKKKVSEIGDVYHFDLFGKREEKYNFLGERNIHSIIFKSPFLDNKNFFLTQRDFKSNNNYLSFIKLDEIFFNYSAGIQTKRDNLFIDSNKPELSQRIIKLMDGSLNQEFINQFNIKDSSSYKITDKIKSLSFNENNLKEVHYRPFDDKFLYYEPALIGRSFFRIMKHLSYDNNFGLVVSKQFVDNFKYVFVSNKICDMNLISNAGAFGAGFSFPLYLYPKTNDQQSIGDTGSRKPNLNMEIVNEIANRLGLEFVPEKADKQPPAEIRTNFAPIDILDYIYAVLHSPLYREKYKEFLKIDFPRVPYPKDQDTFWKLVYLGAELRQLHLLESPVVENYLTQYPIDGDNVVGKVKYNEGRVYINDTQHFSGVPEIAWNFYIGGYQPAQKWLKDCKGRKLDFEDIQHYQKIIVALTETHRLMQEIDKIEMED
jgi:predicted helicase